MSAHHDLYQKAEYYDIAVDFKDVPAECEFLQAVHRELNGKPASSWLELAAGPALHTIEMARRGLKAQALDISPAMIQYGVEKARAKGVQINYLRGDMIDFQLGESVDLAAILMDSASYLLTNDDVCSHLQAVARALNEGGLYVLEMGHPKDVWKIARTAQTEWEMVRDGTKVEMTWGLDTDVLDPLTQITEVTSRMQVTRQGKTEEFIDRSPQRVFTRTEFQALVASSGCFELVREYGAMDKSIALDADKAWRLVSVLRKKSS